MTNATAMPKKIGSTENGLEARFLRALRLRPGLAVPARRASPVRTPPLAFETTRLMFFFGVVLHVSVLIFQSGPRGCA